VYGGWLVAFVLEEPLTDESLAADLNARLAAAIGGKVGTFEEPVSISNAVAVPREPARMRTRDYSDPTHYAFGVPGVSRVSLFCYSPQLDSPRVAMTQFTGNTFKLAALTAAIEGRK
jgi:hypothetical protein